ncbi:SDR family oxidoreductase, partial [Listeria monocytogenes]|nr:SDR family oxidoreductase [Listeria monocytogenes]
VPHMLGRGSGLIVQIASQAGIQGFPREAIYCAAKHAQVGFSRALRRELQPHGIKVGVINPAAVRTKFALGRGRDAEALTH